MARNNYNNRFINFLVALIAILFFCSSVDASENKVCYANSNDSRVLIISNNPPQRLFNRLSNTILNKNVSSASKATLGDAPVITGEDLTKAFAPQNILNWYYIPNVYYLPSDSVYQMDIGGVDYYNPQHWMMPNINLLESDFSKGIPISKAPYREHFLTATHCIKYTYKNPDENYYEFYEISDSAVVMLGIADSLNNPIFVDTVDFLRTPLPLDINTEFTVNDTIYYADGTSTVLIQNISPEGLGTLTTPNGDIEVLKLSNDYTQRDYDENGGLNYEWRVRLYEFISKRGDMLTVALKDGAPLTGITQIDYLEYLKVDYATDVKSEQSELPQQYVLMQNYPNPFNPSTTIKFSLPNRDFVKLKVYDLLGKEVASLVDGELNQGEHSVNFNAAGLSSGVYFYKLSTSSFTETKKMQLTK